MAVQHGQQHGEAVFVQPHAQTPGRGPAAVDQRLNFHQHRPCALQRHHDATAGHRLGVLAQENGARVTHPLETFLGHGKDADFVHRAKAVLDGAHQPKA